MSAIVKLAPFWHIEYSYFVVSCTTSWGSTRTFLIGRGNALIEAAQKHPFSDPTEIEKPFAQENELRERTKKLEQLTIE